MCRQNEELLLRSQPLCNTLSSFSCLQCKLLQVEVGWSCLGELHSDRCDRKCLQPKSGPVQSPNMKERSFSAPFNVSFSWGETGASFMKGHVQQRKNTNRYLNLLGELIIICCYLPSMPNLHPWSFCMLAFSSWLLTKRQLCPTEEQTYFLQHPGKSAFIHLDLDSVWSLWELESLSEWMSVGSVCDSLNISPSSRDAFITSCFHDQLITAGHRCSSQSSAD